LKLKEKEVENASLAERLNDLVTKLKHINPFLENKGITNFMSHDCICTYILRVALCVFSTAGTEQLADTKEIFE
jgi:hypothetical protein